MKKLSLKRIPCYKETLEVCGGCLGHRWMVAEFEQGGIRVYPCGFCNKNGKKKLLFIKKDAKSPNVD